MSKESFSPEEITGKLREALRKGRGRPQGLASRETPEEPSAETKAEAEDVVGTTRQKHDEWRGREIGKLFQGNRRRRS